MLLTFDQVGGMLDALADSFPKALSGGLHALDGRDAEELAAWREEYVTEYDD